MGKKRATSADAAKRPDLLLPAIYHPATFRDLEARLREMLAAHVRRGEISERQLALRTGYTQSHVHNVLKGARGFRADLADALLETVHLSLQDLLQNREAGAEQVPAPCWRGLVGPRHRFPNGAEPGGAWLFPAPFLTRFQSPVLLRLAAEEDGMTPLVEPGDLVLVDRGEAARRKPVFGGIYALALGNQGAICRCQVVGNSLVLVADNPGRAYRLPDRVPLERRSVLEVVRGRVVWTARDLE